MQTHIRWQNDIKQMKTQLIAEIAQAHDGSLGILHSYIDALADTGVHAIKFQMHIAEAESSEYESFRVPFSYVDKTRMDYWKRMEFTEEQWKEIKLHCEEKQVEFLVTPFCTAAVELLENLKVNRYKIGSGNVSDLLLIDRIAMTGKPVILSSGMSDWSELQTAIEAIRKYHENICLLQCTTMYPCPPEQSGILLIPELKRRFKLPVGYSDHTGIWYAVIAAIVAGAEIIEFHVSFDKRMFGPDAKSSLTIDEVKQLAEAITFVEKTMRHSDLKENANQFNDLKKLFGKSLATNKDLKQNHVLRKEDLESKKPEGYGIPSKEYDKLIGKVLLRDMAKYEFINWTDVKNG